MNQEKISNFIKSLRESHNMTQEELAEKIPVGRGAVSKWEHGRTLPDISTLTKLSDILNVSVDEILAGEKNPKKSIALEIYGEKIKITYKFKITVILLFILILIFLLYYFFNQYRSINVFTINGVGENFYIENGIFLNTSEKAYFNSGEIININDVEIEKVELYYSDNGVENILCSTNNKSIFFYDTKGYDEILNFNKLDNIVKNLYLKVYYNNTYENIHLNLKKDYVNDNLLFFNSNKVTNKNPDIDTIYNKNIVNKITEKYIKKDDGYFYEIEENNKKIKLSYMEDAQLLNVFISIGGEVLEEYIYDLTYKYIDYKVAGGNYISLDENCKCVSDKCSEYENYSKICSKLNEIVLNSLK